MSDIVERLHLSANPECWEAADEIERLRDHMRALANTGMDRDTAGIFKGLWQGSEQECERLRAALHNLQGCDIDNAAQDIIIRALEPKP